MSDDLYEYDVSLRFNSRLRGAGQMHDCRVAATGIADAISKAVSQAVRLPQHGQSIYVTGASVDEVHQRDDIDLGPPLRVGDEATYVPDKARSHEAHDVIITDKVEGWFEVKFSDSSTCIVRPSRLKQRKEQDMGTGPDPGVRPPASDLP